jgi:hypothetical protein
MNAPIRVLLIVLLSVMTQSCLGHATDQRSTRAAFDKGDHQMPEEELQRRGKELRVVIDRKHEEWSYAIGKLGPNARVDGVVNEYIPVGMSFEDAEYILAAAGLTCNIVDKPATFPPALYGSLDFPMPWFAKASFNITIYPKRRGDFHSGVKEVEARFHYATL